MNVDIATSALLAQLAASGGPPIHQLSAVDARLVSNAIAASYPPGPEVEVVRDVEIPASDGAKIRARVLCASDAPRAVLVFYHGGGWVLSNIDTYDTLGRQLAVRTGAAVVMVDYRKAPEHPFPTPVNDAWDALVWASDQMADLAGGQVPLIVAGDSAGGNLAAVVCQKAKAAGGPEIAAQVLVYPVTDAAMDTKSYADPANQLLLNADLMRWFWDHYAPDPEDRNRPEASPLRADDLSGLPPAIVVAAQRDPLLDETLAYADRLEAAGVAVTRKVFEKQMHNFFAMPGLLPAQAEAVEYVGEQIDRRLGKASEVDAVIVGAGFSGLYQLYRLREMGLSTRTFEAGDDVGGTWYWNRYPGARCDIESMAYSYGFSEELEQDWVWTERYAAQPEILRYAEHVADRFDLKKDITFETRVERAVFDEESGRWFVHTDSGEVVSAQFLIMATGCLSVPKQPDIPGAETFRGPTYITGLWPHDGVDFTGKRVAVIGTGSSAIQSIPLIAEQAKHLSVYQRTPAYSMPAQNRPLTNSEISEMKEHYRAYRDAQRGHPAGIPVPERSWTPLQAASDNERAAMFEERWEGGILTGLTGSYSNVLTDQEANDVVSEFVRRKIRETVNDPETAEALCPKSFPIGTKRACLDTNYYQTFNRDNVELVDLQKTPIREITESGIRLDGREDAFDAIVFATGFDAMTGALDRIDIRGIGGRALKDEWADGPHSYLGLCVAGFPNLFTITGPSSPSVLSNMMVSIEQHVDWITGCIGWMRERGLASIEATEEAELEWAKHNEQTANLTLFPQANSWYIGANVPGKPRTFMAYVAGVDVYRYICDSVAADGYAGFRLAAAP